MWWTRGSLTLLSVSILYPEISDARSFDHSSNTVPSNSIKSDLSYQDYSSLSEEEESSHVKPPPFEPFFDPFHHDYYVGNVNNLEFQDDVIDNIERGRNGSLYDFNIPSHGGNSSSPILRNLSVNSATIGNFTQLNCNDPTSASWTSCDSLVSNILPVSGSGDALVIPCGKCYTFDLEGEVDLPGGIHVKGKLVFPLNHEATIYTPSVIVEGELNISVDHPKVSPNNMATNFVLTGTEDVMFTPSDSPNENACLNQTNSICNLGPKPFVIAGGRVNISSMPETCATHTPLLKQRRKDPVYDPDDFPKFVTLPSTCPQSGSRSFISYDFEGGYGNWTGHDGAFMVMEDGAVRVTNRLLSDRGPYLDLTPLQPSACLVPNQDYVFVARIKLDMANGTMQGEETSCKKSGEFCPRLYFFHHNRDRGSSSHKATLPKHKAPRYGEYVDFTQTIRFSEEELSPNNAYLTMRLYYVEEEIDITMDSFDLFLPSESSYQNPNAVCHELIMNGDAEGNGFSPYPMTNTHSYESLNIVEEDGNKFWRLENRNSRASSLQQKLDTNCFRRGTTYSLSSRIRYHNSEGFIGGSEAYYWYIRYRNPDDENKWVERRVVECDKQSVDDGWVTCTGDFLINEQLSLTTEAYVRIALYNQRDGDKYDLDYDDISISYSKGYVDELVVESGDVSCWGPNADVHVTSATFLNYHSENGYVTKIKETIENDDGTTSIILKEALTTLVISKEEDDIDAVEVALLSRNVRIEGDSDEDNKGGYMQVLHTPGIIQLVQGVEFYNMGRRSEADRFALQLLYSGNLEGTSISRNSFRNSNQRCISVEGTSNLLISDNTAYRTYGHCILLGYNSKFNIITRNLVSESKVISWVDRIDGESDYHPAGFLVWYNPNDLMDNIAVAGERNGFVLQNNWRTRLEDNSWLNESVRRIKMGLFQRNVARSNGDYGFYLSHQETGEEVIFSEIKAVKNRHRGIFINGSYNVTIANSLFSDNTRYGIQINWSDNLQIKDTLIRGHRESTKNFVKQPYFNKPCDSDNYFVPAIGLLLPTEIWSWERKDNIGITLSNVHFMDFDHVDSCEASVPISFSAEKRNNHFDYVTMFNNVTIDGRKLMDAPASGLEGTKDIVIHDINGSSDPSGQASSQPGMFVSSVRWLKDFASGSCKPYPNGISYCPNNCFRTVSFMVDQSISENFDLVVTNRGSGETVIVPSVSYRYQQDDQRKLYYDFFRFFSVSLPSDSYKLSFTENLQPVWPRFVLSRWEGVPSCTGFVSSENITLEEPDIECDDLVLNGDMELGTKYWLHRNGGDPDRGEMVVVEGGGIDNSTALMLINRDSRYQAIGQHLDTRCFHKNLNNFFEIKLYFRLENNTEPFLCDPFSTNEETQCPSVTLREETVVDEIRQNRYTHDHARVVIPNNLGNLNLVHGVVKIDESRQALDRVFMYLEFMHKDFDVVMDEVSVKKLPGINVCEDEDLIRNGNFEQNSMYWWRYGNPSFDIETSSNNKFMKVMNREHHWNGLYQDLFIDKTCFKEKQRFQVIAKYRMESAQNNTSYECDRKQSGGELRCGFAIIRADSLLGSEDSWVAETAFVHNNIKDEWSVLAGIMTVTKKQAAHTRLYLKLTEQDPSMNIFYDDIKIIPAPKTCDVLNGDFESGDTRFWRSQHRFITNAEISNHGDGGSNYSMMIQTYTNNGIYQELDSRCLEEGQEFQISARFKYVNTTDYITGVDCSETVLSWGDERHCPAIRIEGESCDGNNIGYEFWNEIDQFSWNKDEFNDFVVTFPISTEIATCDTVKLILGRYTHNDRALLVDNVRIEQRTTNAPTPHPTFMPTKSMNAGPTLHPTILTEAPTTTNVVSCPLVGDTSISVSSGSVILGTALDSTLCTLTKVTSSDTGDVITIPIARSYENNPWEKAAGEYSESIFAERGILCYDAGCQINLPAIEPGSEFKLSTYAYEVSKVDEAARFLESATFGITSEELAPFSASPHDVKEEIISWVSQQINTTMTPMTSHREFWRRGLNGRHLHSTNTATATHPCSVFSKWRKISFVHLDNQWNLEKKLRVVGSGPFVLIFNGWMRTVVDQIIIDQADYANYTFNPNVDYTLCGNPEARINGSLRILIDEENCVTIQNPPVNLDGFEDQVSTIFNLNVLDLQPQDQWWNNGEELVFSLRKSLFDDHSFTSICNNLPTVPDLGDEPIFAKLNDGNWLMFDPSLHLQSNTAEAPIVDGGKRIHEASGGDTFCSNAPRTFLNENQCLVSSNACTTNTNTAIDITLDNSTINILNQLTGRYVYAIMGVLVNYNGIALKHPCSPGLRSRWEPKNLTECSPTEIYSATNTSLFTLLSESNDRNPYIRDIYFPEEGLYCNVTDTDPEIEIEVDGVCWTRVHDEYMSVFDMTYWVDNHPGGEYAIKKWSQDNGTVLVYPSNKSQREHGMSRWNNNWHKFSYVGRFGDVLRLGDLPNDLRRVEVLDYFDDSDRTIDSLTMVCGSPGEVSNNKTSGFLFDADTGYQTVPWYPGNNRKYVWIMIALSAKDQLRQRVAWALSQILVVVKDAIGEEYAKSEWFVSYYDIFVRNAFGNYRDILKEISYNPLMAENLSYLGSKSSAYMLERYKVKTSADENFAREIMQLFTMGVTLLNMDGSQKKDENGNTRLSYTNDDIMSLSRIWTGFDIQQRRGNIEGYNNRIDPMKIVPEWRDRFPKTDTTGGYIGDTYALCSDFPSKSFLRKGATYRFLGSSHLPELSSDPAEFARYNVTKAILDQTSNLRSLLCNADGNGKCQFRNSITLETNIECTGIECDIDTFRVVQVENNVYYEFVPSPCVNLAFYNNPVKISPRYSSWDVMCANPKLPVASEACCSIGSNSADRNSKYAGERMTFKTAETRCGSMSKNVCDFYQVNGDWHLNLGYFWTTDSCLLRVKIKRDGTVTIVHKPSDFLEMVTHVDASNENYFHVHWQGNKGYPTVDTNCDNRVCHVSSDGACICNTGVIDSVVFQNMPSSKKEILDKLHIGAVDPSVFDAGTYSTITDVETNITAHRTNNEFNTDTIFEFMDDNGRTFLMKNVQSIVYLRGITSGFTGQSFRNAPQFMSFIPSETTLRDAQYETEAVLDHYFYHPNTAPFIAMRLIQRLVTSNPSPSYIESVANAFKSGVHEYRGVQFGKSRYGDLEATISAIFLNSASRDVVLDADLTSGSLREPILKVMALLRSMNFISTAPVIAMNDFMNDIGQMAHEFVSVFSFFLPEFKPYGKVGDATLVSPEATLLDMPKMIGLLNGLSSLVNYGLSNCDGGWGIHCRERPYLQSSSGILEFNKAIKSNFSVETFEGPSLVGGLDNLWVGRDYYSHNGETTIDSLDPKNHVLHFPDSSWNGDFFSPLIINNSDQSGEPYVVKFRYRNTINRAGGCIGYVDGTRTYLNTQTWEMCDDGNDLVSNGVWISCQVVIPRELESFRIVVGDRYYPGGDAFFDDIQLARGNEDTCEGVNVPKIDPPGRSGYATTVVDNLATLLTAGRLGNAARAVITDAFNKAGSADDGLRMAQNLIITTAEFHTTNIAKSTSQPRDEFSFPQPTGKPYKAVIYLMLSGGCDSFNMLTPHTCSNGLYESYLSVRQQVALPKNRLFSIPASDQVCSKFGIHPELPFVKDLYDDGDMLFFANTGVLSQPVNKENYYVLTNTQLFAHNHMQRETKRIDPYESASGTGVLGRMSDVLTGKGHNVGSFSIDRFSVALVGEPGITESPIIISNRGVTPLYFDDKGKELIPNLHNTSDIDGGIFADTWSASLMKAIGTNNLLTDQLSGTSTTTEFPNNHLGYSLNTVARLIKTREVRGVDVDTFYIETGGFDTHADVEENLNRLFSEMNEALGAFTSEMKALDVWDDVTLIQTSDFARTLNPNGGDGTDHAWGGNYMLMGGSVKGGQILGKYPEDITDDGPLTLGRGRMIPTTPWDAVFRGIASWLGIGEDKMAQVFPNLHNFNSSYLFDLEEMFDVTVTSAPSNAPHEATSTPSVEPSALVSSTPSNSPNEATLSLNPSNAPSNVPSMTPSSTPSTIASVEPSLWRSVNPSNSPTSQPSLDSSVAPTEILSLLPTLIPSAAPSNDPSSEPSLHHSSKPSILASSEPSLICRDTSLEWGAETRLRSCSWVAKKPDRRCGLTGVSELCSKTCGSCYTCVDTTIAFYFEWNGSTRRSKCQFFARNPIKRCKVDGASDACPLTCGRC